jgi:SAM-dependent methyltransferase
MLDEHLTQEHDRASRRLSVVDLHVNWIDRVLLHGQRASILDLGCGPGLYASRLAKLGHTCTGIDYSPASIAFAREEAQRQRLTATYVEDDIRHANFGTGYMLAMLIYGELNIFRPAHAVDILKKAYAALRPGGLLLLEPHTMEAVQRMGESKSSWFAAHSGLFSNRPHLVLTEASWHADSQTTTMRYFRIDAASGDVSLFAQTFQAYSDSAYRDLLTSCGFNTIEFYASLEGGAAAQASDLFAAVARKPHKPTHHP